MHGSSDKDLLNKHRGGLLLPAPSQLMLRLRFARRQQKSACESLQAIMLFGPRAYAGWHRCFECGVPRPLHALPSPSRAFLTNPAMCPLAHI